MRGVATSRGAGRSEANGWCVAGARGVALVLVAAAFVGGGCRSNGGEEPATERLPAWCTESPIVVPELLPEPCEDVAESCDAGERWVCGAGCVDRFNRVCNVDPDCEPDEVCRLVEPDDTIGTCLYVGWSPTCCPGGPGCDDDADEAELVLRAGFAAVDITPRGWEVPRPGFVSGSTFTGRIDDPATFCDCGSDGICPPGEEYEDCPSFGAVYPGPDADGTEGDGRMQSMWIAGFGNGRPAELCGEDELGDDCVGPDCCVSPLAHDPIWARAMVLDRGATRVAFVVLDVVGYFHDEIMVIREALPESLGIDYLLISSTHTHEAPDTMGQWGPGSPAPQVTGFTPYWRDEIRQHVTDAISQAVAALEPVDVHVADVDTGAEGLAYRDSRDPFVMDDRLTIAAFVREGSAPGDPGATLGTLINWHNHPEVLWSRNTRITSDFPHYVREYVEQGLPEVALEGGGTAPAIPGLGGVAIYVTGIVGGLTTPGGVSAIDRAGVEHSGDTFAKADAVGQRLAEFALVALAEQGERLEEDLLVRSRTFLLPVRNTLLILAVKSFGALDRRVFNNRARDPASGRRPPMVRTAVTRISLGELTIQSIPGEIFPELVVGFNEGNAVSNPVLGDPYNRACGADGLPATGGDQPCIVSPSNEYPPPLDDAPQDRFLRATLPGRYHIYAGLGDDELGYLVPSYDYVVLPLPLAYLNAAPGSHYEETNSIADVVDELLEHIFALYEGELTEPTPSEDTGAQP